jgi:hypothetical protein
MLQNNEKLALGYVNAINEICKSLEIINPMDEWDIGGKFSEKISHLRDKNKYPFNKNGDVDFQQYALEFELSNTRIRIGEVHFWKNLGLCKMKPINTTYGEFRRFNRGFNYKDLWFFRSVDDSYNRLYNCWQRIANILNIFFKVITDSRFVLLKPVLDNIKKIYPGVSNDTSYKWLKDFLDNRYSSTINYKRIKITHIECSSSAYIVQFLRNMDNTVEQDALEKERDEWPQLLIEFYNDTLEGVNNMLELISNQIKLNGALL